MSHSHRSDAVVIYFACPICDHVHRAAVSMAGRRTACPLCDRPLTVPTVSTALLGGDDTWRDLPLATADE